MTFRLLKYILLGSLIVSITACETMSSSGSLTEAAIKQVKLNHQRKKERVAQQKAVAKTPAILAAEKIRDQNPESPEAWYDLGVAYWADFEKTERQFSHDQAIINFETLLKKVPGNVSTIKALYNIYYRDIISGDEKAYAVAKNYYNQLAVNYQQELNPPSLAKFIHLYYQQQRAANVDYPLLHSSLLTAIQEQPRSDFSYIQLAKLYSQQTYYPLAIATLQLGLEQSPESVDLLKAIGSTYEARASANGCHYDNLNLIQKAGSYYLRAVAKESDKNELHRGLARLYLDRNMPQLASHETSLLLDIKQDAANYALAAHNFALMGNKNKSNQYLESAKSAGLSASDSAYHEVYMMNGDWLRAALSFTDYIQAQKEIHVYDAIKADIIARESQVNLSSMIAKKSIRYDSDWQTLIYAWWQGELAYEKLEPMVSNRCERAELYFYSGYKALLTGDSVKAKSAFKKTVEQNTYRFIERPLAKSFLAKMK